MDVEQDFWWAQRKDPGVLDVMKTRGDKVEEGHIDLTPKWQLTAAEKGAVLKFDSSDMIGSQRLCQNLIGLTEIVTPWVSFVSWKEREKIKIVFLIELPLSFIS